MKRIIISSILFFYFVPTIFSQSMHAISAGFGVIKSYDTAEGVALSFKRGITDNFAFQISAGYYLWSEKLDLNGFEFNRTTHTSYSDYTRNHIRQEITKLIPIRFGLNYKFGSSLSRPYLSVEWAVNSITYDNFTPIPVADESTPFIREYSKSTLTTIALSLGFSMGYSFYLNEDLNIVAGVIYQRGGRFVQYVGLVSGIEFNL